MLPVGKGRTRRYFARRTVANESAIPIYRVTRDGHCAQFADWSAGLYSVAMNRVKRNFSADNRSFTVGERTFLQSVRFDRCAAGAERYGRAGVVSFASLDLELVGDAGLAWPSLAVRLHQQNVISEQAMVDAAVARCIGRRLKPWLRNFGCE